MPPGHYCGAGQTRKKGEPWFSQRSGELKNMSDKQLLRKWDHMEHGPRETPQTGSWPGETSGSMNLWDCHSVSGLYMTSYYHQRTSPVGDLEMTQSAAYVIGQVHLSMFFHPVQNHLHTEDSVCWHDVVLRESWLTGLKMRERRNLVVTRNITLPL